MSMRMVRAADGNMSTFDGRTLTITRTGSELGRLDERDLIIGGIDSDLAGASSDIEVHRRLYRERGAGAVAHAHPSGTVPEGEGGPGEHGVYLFAATLEQAVADVVRRAREQDA